MDQNLPWKIIDKFFTDNQHVLAKHHINSYNEFYFRDINRIFKEQNPIKIIKMQDEITKEFHLQCKLYMGGRNGDKIYFGKPIIFDNDREHFMYPNEARLRNMTYGITIHYDVDVEFNIYQNGEFVESQITLDKIYLGRFPIMIHSDLCILKSLTDSVRFNMGECKNDIGGYFIIDGKEKVIIPQEKFADNMLYIRDKVNDIYSHSADIRSVSEDSSKPVRTFSIRIVAPTPSQTNNQIVVNVPNVRKPIPLFILMRALGVISDKEIITYCLLDLEKYETYMDLFIPSIHDAGKIFTQDVAIKYIASFTKGKTVSHTLEILMNYMLPHVGELNFKNKAYYIGHMVFELLKVFTKNNKPTDRDNFKFKRVELPGKLIYDLFKEYYSLQKRSIFQKIDKEFYYKKGIYQSNFIGLIENNYKMFFSERVVEAGFKKAFKGNWGAEAHTKRLGVLQGLNRLSFNSAISHLRKINLPFDSSAKVTGPRLLHGSQWGIIDPADTPDGGNVGLHKHLAISSHITSGYSAKPLIKLLHSLINLQWLEECTPKYLANATKVFINGTWIGVVTDPYVSMLTLRTYRRNALIPIYTSINWQIDVNCINIYTDSGRICRPLFYINQLNGEPSYMRKGIMDKLEGDDFTWEELICGFSKKKDANFNYDLLKIYPEVKDLYNTRNLESLTENQAVIEFIDSSEASSSLVAVYDTQLNKHPYTHIEIHPSLLYGVMGNQVVFPENNASSRNVFACGQGKQAVSLYHSNFQVRIDKMGIILNSGQMPIVKSRYLKYINNEQHPYGENVIVAIMVYGSYNVEDSILFNEGSIKRGMFRTTYYNMYEAYEESSKVGVSEVDSSFANIENSDAIKLKPGYDYSELDEHGLIKENTVLDDKKVLIGKITKNTEDPDISIDSSVMPKKGQLGYVDKTFITEGEAGHRIAKVRIREERIPAIGDKFCSRCGQKGTIGLVIPEENMPFTKDGLKPDIIINPHALPSRMTIGQLVESLMGKACVLYGGFGDCTAFNNNGTKNERFGKMLTDQGFHSSGDQILYNGESGEQIYSTIYIGPTYYMRLKHMVKDKINYRALGPRTVLTRQAVQGRANDGGLRIGEMERDCISSYGATQFLKESMLVRGDDYYIAVCNKSGTLAIYNENMNIFLSLFADGPIRFIKNVDDSLNIDNISKHGKDFSIIRVPYAFKLLMHELQSMNIQMRLITEDNVDQLTNMTFSNNIDLLMHSEGENISIKQLVRDNYSKLANNDTTKATVLNETPDKNIPNTPEADPNTPPVPPHTPEDNTNAVNSPPWTPHTPEDNTNAVNSPPWVPNSPEYNPNAVNSPPWVPNSPEYNPNAVNSPPWVPQTPEEKQGPVTSNEAENTSILNKITQLLSTSKDDSKEAEDVSEDIQIVKKDKNTDEADENDEEDKKDKSKGDIIHSEKLGDEDSLLLTITK